MSDNEPIPRKDLFEEYPSLLRELTVLMDERNKQTITLGNIWKAADGKYMQDDALFHAISDRSVSLIDGFIRLIEKWNFVAAAALVRLQLDSMLRLYYIAQHPTERHRILQEWLGGAQFDKIKMMKDGKQQMKDWNLCEEIKPIFPRVHDIYSELCDYVHLSTKHLTLTATSIEGRTVGFAISSTKDHLPEDQYRKLLQMFIEFSRLINTALDGWLSWKTINLIEKR
ncbi:MAG: hypothetical protein WCS85_04980 [Candidatus Peribacteraceae bacterium]|jgi:hypothetical protein